MKKTTKATKSTPAPKEPTNARKITERLSGDELKKEIDALLAELKSSNDAEDKKRIRRALRVRGHRGGLGARAERK